MPPKKKHRGANLDAFFRSDSSSSSFSVGTENEDDEQDLQENQRTQRKFVLRWRLLFPWVEFEDGEGEERLYCRDCRAAKLKNAYSIGKQRPKGGWKKEYLQRHAISNDHVRFASETYMFSPDLLSRSIGSSERETLGLLRNIYFLVKNSTSLNKSSVLHSLIDDHLLFTCIISFTQFWYRD